MRAIVAVAVCLTLAACQTAVPVDRPCGIIRDDLRGVTANDKAGQARLDVHFIRGHAAGCW